VKRETTLRIKGARHSLGARTWIMGVVNATPDSFFDGGLHADPASAVAHGLQLVGEARTSWTSAAKVPGPARIP